MTTTTASASCTENIRLIREMLKTVKPNDLTDDEIVAMVEILRAAADRKQETQPGVVYLDLVRSGQRTRR
jgi:hypothetical protein